ncbi:MAG: glycosyltransferase [Rhodoferax sp.]|uniref:MGDG synthase family glycosyltransferase n=1 Tax=Rhodoferax sp. TaxID=50421 RepID=UPI0026158EA3|nr:glycosyltransferase [Rhodoferax sp.]MDD5336662.1 glycosyltransferase [Rhodoferax sp.]
MSVPQTWGVDPLIVLALVAAFTLLAALVWLALRRGRARRRAADAPAAGDAGAAQPRKIVIFYSSIGHGHISAAQAIEQEIGRLAPDVRVVLQDIREFMHPLWRWVDERLYWFIADNLPESFDALFHALQARGKRVPSLAWLSNDYPEDKVRAFLEAQAPDAILATHYGSAQVLGTLRERGLLAQMKIGWLHTDFFEGYFPRISKRIDRTFLAHPELEARWLAAGVAPEKVTTSGMPVRAPADDGRTREMDLTALGLDPNVPTVLITSCKEGVGDYALVVESLARHHQGPLQIIAVCGANARQQALLNVLRTALQKRLPDPVTLKVCGLVPHADLLAWMRAANLLITKAGGMTPAEAFAVGTPTILLDVVSGHERENAALFVRLGVAELADTLAQAGELAAAVLADPQRQAAMRRAQRAFHDNADLGRIARFALDPALPAPGLAPDFGAEHGSAVDGIEAALARLQAETPCDIELLLSYSTAKTPQRVVLENPFGHIAIRVDATVYSANYIAVPGHDPNLLQHVTLADYLYGVQPLSPSQVHTNTYGMAYGRETLGLRVAGVAAQRKAAMVAEAHRIEGEFRQGRLLWDRSEFNCADVVVRILRAGGYDRSPPLGRQWLPLMPLDIFEEARQACQEDASLRMELVAYRQVPGAQAAYRFSRFPLSLGQPLRSVARALREAPREPLEAAATKQLTGYFGDQQLYFEDLRGHGSGALADDPTHFSRVQRSLADALATDLRRLLAAQARRPLQEIGRLGELDGAQDIRHLLERSLALARIATERADEVLQDRGARRMRALFTELVGEYGRIGAWRMRRQEIEAYLKRFQVFEAAVGREFPARPGARPARATTLQRSLRYGIRRLRRCVGGRHRPAGHGPDKEASQ